MQVIIIGGGIAGLSQALSLHQIGVPCRVYEAAPALSPLGYGINLQPNAIRELSALGLGEKLAAAGILTQELAFYNKHGQLIWTEPRGRAAGYRWRRFRFRGASCTRSCLRRCTSGSGQTPSSPAIA